MPLTPEEFAFLAPTWWEYEQLRFGPAWAVLRERGVKYWDIKWLMEAYGYVDPPRIVTVTTPDGATSEVFEIGHQIDPLPKCPWPDVEAARRRDAEIEPEVQACRSALKKEQTS